MNRRYLLFAFWDYYPLGGLNDLVGGFDSMGNILEYANERYTNDDYNELVHDYDHYHVLDTEQNIKIQLTMFKDSWMLKSANEVECDIDS